MINHTSAQTVLISLLMLAQLFAPTIARTSRLQNPSTSSGQQPSTPQPETLDSLRARITAHIAQPRFAPVAWGVKAISLDTGKIIFEHNAGKYFSPASNAKLYTTALALARLGGDFRIKTSAYATAQPDAAGTVKGDVIVYGRGDPTITARLAGGDYYKALEPLAAALFSAGVRRVEGDLIGDESYFVGPPFGSGWQWDDLQWDYGAEVSALSINDNALDLFVKPGERAGIPCRVTTGPPTSFVTLMNRTQTTPKGTEPRIAVHRPVGENTIYVSGSFPVGDAGYSGKIAVHNPAGLFVVLFKEALARLGIIVTGRTRTIDWKYREVTPIDFRKLVELGSIESLPLKEIVRETMKPSQNLYSQLLLLQVGASQGAGAGGQGPRAGAKASDTESTAFQSLFLPDPRLFKTTEEIGIEAMKAFLAEVGIKKGDVLLEEGSGLSRANIITAGATVALLEFMSRHRWADAYRDSLPIAGVDGTLKNRMKGTAAAENVRAKTGTLRYVYTLSGYLTTAASERVAFSIMLNNYYNADRTIPARDDVDAIAIMLAGFTGRSSG